MVDLLHWDCAVSFTGEEAAALAVGEDPNSHGYTGIRGRPLCARMEVSYKSAKSACVREHPMEVPIHTPITCLESVDLCKHREGQTPKAYSIFEEWLGSTRSLFILQKFTRAELARWFAVSEIPSRYRFDLKQTEQVFKSDIDPSDLPIELAAANIAFDVVTKGYGNPLATFRNRLVGYLEKNFPSLNNEAVQRIATVANPDKTTGRKKSNAE